MLCARVLSFGSFIALGLSALTPTLAVEAVHHDLQVSLEPSEHAIAVTDRLDLPAPLGESANETLRFVLHAGLEVTEPIDGFDLEILGREPDRARYGINEEGGGAPGVPLREYRLHPTPEADSHPSSVTLRYHGTIHHPLVQENEEYGRSFSRTPGTIEEQGVVLSGSTWWLPDFGQALETFRMEIELPETWDAVSQGTRIRHEIARGRRMVTWDSPEPMDEVYLVAARFTEYSRPAGAATAFAFLRAPDANLAAKYLEATARYIEMYRNLIGPYPYGKFALVENFWDTGYGMPSFTLLGPRVIRFPFILHSSYPHEILHNWWGNSVFVDYDDRQLVRGADGLSRGPLDQGGSGEGSRIPTGHVEQVPELRPRREGLSLDRVPLPSLFGHRGGRVREVDDVVAHAAPADRRRHVRGRVETFLS